MKNSKIFVLATINTFIGFPIVKEFFRSFKKTGYVHSIQNAFSNFSNFLENSNSHYLIKNYSSSKDFNKQTLFDKILKYIKLFVYLTKIIFINTIKKNEITIYCFDIFTLYLSIFLKRKNIRIIYHQFELIEEISLNKFDYFLFDRIKSHFFKVDFAIFPEKNRLLYFKKKIKCNTNTEYIIIPNSNNNISSIKRSFTNKKIKVTHIGAVGKDHNFLNYLDAIKKLPVDKYEFIFAGILDSEVMNLIESSKIKNCILLGQIRHEELEQVYLETDIGVILYKDVSLNHRFCAPNKLYEYWSYGIPVIGDKLPGLKGVFVKSDLGKLIDMNEVNEISSTIESIGKLNLQSSSRIKNIFKSKYSLVNFDLSEKLKLNNN